ncbi:MAG: hypothetical protein ABL871_11335 [Terricaulis sp.]
MPFHYVFSEVAICLASGWGASRLFRDQQAIGAFGVALFAVAAIIGIVRIATGADELLAPAHRFASQAGGTFGLVLIVSQIAKHRGWEPSLLAILASAVAAGLAAVAGGVLGSLIFLALLTCGTLLLATNFRRSGRALAVIGFASMAPNILFVRQSASLDPAVSWHAYHVITALWLIAIVAALHPAPNHSADLLPASG